MRKFIVLTALMFVAGYTGNLLAEDVVHAKNDAGDGTHLTQNDKNQVADNLAGEGDAGSKDASKAALDGKFKLGSNENVFPKAQFDHKSQISKKNKNGFIKGENGYLKYDAKNSGHASLKNQGKNTYKDGEDGVNRVKPKIGKNGFIKGENGYLKYDAKNSGHVSLKNKGKNGYIKGETSFIKGETGPLKNQRGFLKSDKGMKKFNLGKNNPSSKQGKNGIIIEGKNAQGDKLSNTGDTFQKADSFHKAGDAMGASGGAGMPAGKIKQPATNNRQNIFKSPRNFPGGFFYFKLTGEPEPGPIKALRLRALNKPRNRFPSSFPGSRTSVIKVFSRPEGHPDGHNRPGPVGTGAPPSCWKHNNWSHKGAEARRTR